MTRDGLLQPGDRVEVRHGIGTRGRRGTVLYRRGRRGVVVQLDQIVLGRNVLSWHESKFRKLETGEEPHR
jgi:hypothetical protein